MVLGTWHHRLERVDVITCAAKSGYNAKRS